MDVRVFRAVLLTDKTAQQDAPPRKRLTFEGWKEPLKLRRKDFAALCELEKGHSKMHCPGCAWDPIKVRSDDVGLHDLRGSREKQA